MADERDNRRQTSDGFLTKALDPLAFKANAEQGVLSGYASKFWVVDSYGEATAPGAFQKSITERGPKSDTPRVLLRYEHEYTIGTHTALSEDASGLAIEAKISDDGMYGTAVRRQLADAVPYGLSIGFRRIGWRTATEDDPLILDSAPPWAKVMAETDPAQISILTEVKLMENSVVSFPAVDNALVDAYRADDLNGRALQRVLADLKSGRLTAAHLATLTSIAQAMPADRTPEHQRDAGSTTPPSDSSASVRNYLAEIEIILADVALTSARARLGAH